MDPDKGTEHLTDNIERNLNYYKEHSKNFKASRKIGIILLKTFKKEIAISILLSVVSDFAGIVNLFFTSYFIQWLKDEDAPIATGYIFAFVLGLLILVSAWTRNYFLFQASVTGINVRQGLSGIIYKKILKFNQKSKAKATSGKLVTIVSGELQLLERGLIITPALISAPITLFFAMIMLAILFGEAAIFGVIVAILIMGVQILSSKMMRKYRYMEGFYSDKRLKTISDIINGIRTIKAYAWEIPFLNLVSKHRRNMMKNTLKAESIESTQWGFACASGYIIGVVMFGYHWGMGRTLEYEDALAGIGILGIISMTVFFQFFLGVTNFANLLTVLKRIGEVIDMDEFEDVRDCQIEQNPDKKAIRINLEEVSSTWGFSIKKNLDKNVQEIKEDLSDVNLDSINFKASDGDLIAVVGTVG
jgi:ABC-type multidrug transport system fused ATPase/permease subunit